MHEHLTFIKSFHLQKSVSENIYGEHSAHCKKPTILFYAARLELHKLNGINQSECSKKHNFFLSIFLLLLDEYMNEQDQMKMTELPNKWNEHRLEFKKSFSIILRSSCGENESFIAKGGEKRHTSKNDFVSHKKEHVIVIHQLYSFFLIEL